MGMNERETSATRYLVVKGSGGAGIGDKVRALISAIAYARLSGRQLYVDWNDPAYGGGNANYFNDLFRLEGLAVAPHRPLYGTVRPEAWQGKLHLNWDQLYAEWGTPSWNRVWAQDIFSFDQGRLDWPEDICVMWDFDQFNKIAHHLERLYPAQAGTRVLEQQQGLILRRHVKPSEAIEALTSSYAERLQSLRPYIGVHVRASTEHYAARDAPPVSRYVKITRNLMRQEKARGVFLATDNRDVQKLFSKTFGQDQVVWTEKWMPAPGVALHLENDCPDRLQSARDAVADILLLASADYLVTMGNSSFSMLARMFSTTPDEDRTTLTWKAPVWRRGLRRLGWTGRRT